MTITVRRTFSFSIDTLESLQEEVPFSERSEFIDEAVFNALTQFKHNQTNRTKKLDLEKARRSVSHSS